MKLAHHHTTSWFKVDKWVCTRLTPMKSTTFTFKSDLWTHFFSQTSKSVRPLVRSKCHDSKPTWKGIQQWSAPKDEVMVPYYDLSQESQRLRVSPVLCAGGQVEHRAWTCEMEATILPASPPFSLSFPSSPSFFFSSACPASLPVILREGSLRGWTTVEFGGVRCGTSGCCFQNKRMLHRWGCFCLLILGWVLTI